MQVRALLRGWIRLVTGVGREAENRRGRLGPFTAELGREVDYRPVERDGAQRAATLLAELV